MDFLRKVFFTIVTTLIILLLIIIEYDTTKAFRKIILENQPCELIADLGDIRVYADKMGGAFIKPDTEL